jgi:hypothetical protein
MCTEIFIGSSSKEDLSLVDSVTGFWVKAVNQPHHHSSIALGVKRTYEIGSFLGCSCGFSFGTWSKNDPTEEHEKRRANAKALKDFLLKYSAKVTGIVTFFKYTYAKPEEFPKVKFPIGLLEAAEFDFEDDVVYEIEWPDV